MLPRVPIFLVGLHFSQLLALAGTGYTLSFPIPGGCGFIIGKTTGGILFKGERFTINPAVKYMEGMIVVLKADQ